MLAYATLKPYVLVLRILCVQKNIEPSEGSDCGPLPLERWTVSSSFLCAVFSLIRKLTKVILIDLQAGQGLVKLGTLLGADQSTWRASIIPEEEIAQAQSHEDGVVQPVRREISTSRRAF